MRGQHARPVQPGENVVVSIRPEKARLVSTDDASGLPDDAKPFPVTVERVAYIGSDTRIQVRFGTQQSFNVWEQNARSTLDRSEYWQQGEQGLLWWPPENALVLTE